MSSSPSATTAALPAVSRPESVEAATLAETTMTSEKKEAEVAPAEKSSTDLGADIEKDGGAERVEESADDESRFIGGTKLALIFVGLLSSVFLVALDNTIVSTALPSIVSHFDALSQTTWVIAAYFLTQAGFMLTGGQLLTVASTKILFLVSIVIFEVGSFICGIAPTVNVLIFGRAFAGMGGACIFVTVLSIIAEITRLKDRPIFFGAFGALFALSSVIGPLLGGAFTDHVTWRWCFYINLPFGAIAIATVFFFLPNRKARPRPGTENWTTRQKWLKIDVIGSILCLGLVTALLLPMEWGGFLKAWNDPAVIACFCVFGVLVVAFVYWEYRMGENAILPLNLLLNRTQIGCILEAFMIFLGLLLAIYYLPLYYQAKGHSATRSGIDILPFQLATVLTAMGSGATINAKGRYWPFLFLSPLLVSVGAGLLYTMSSDISNAKVIGYQIILGVGVGGALQNSVIAIQAEFADREHLVPQTTAIVSWGQLLGGIIGVAIAGNIFANGLGKFLPADLPEDVRSQVRASVSVIFTLPEEQRAAVVSAYIKSIDQVFLMGIPAGVLGSLSALLISNHNLRERSKLQSTTMAH